MKKFAFVSDFDGTLTKRDFYHIIIDTYLQEWGRPFYEDWKKTRKINVEFLNKIFGAMGKTEEEILAEICRIPLDEHAETFIEKVKKAGGEFYIVSAGTAYYIDLLLAHRHIEGVKVISMAGVYKDGGIEIIPDEESPYFSEVFGVNKAKIIEDLKKEFETVFFAGDSEPDLGAAKGADVAFAKNELKELLEKEEKEFIAFDNYREIEQYLQDKGWI
ncbi:MtnX-like HAD-IB family phosphatase [Pelosinus sp. sgz500959]|uniref:MtnX-like HAD-IB family phosphatase n=1 Tax=Pelosinus sp. sgz500959 TaxID=3242472 RepID=UPI003671B670